MTRWYEQDNKYMERALNLALMGWGKTNPNPLVGAVLVKNGNIVGEGYHREFGDKHAEVMAIENAGETVRGSTMYVTLEPCSHYGKTPPCVDKIIQAGIKKVVLSWLDPNKDVSGKGVKKLKEAGIEVETGLLEKEAKRQNEIFKKYITEKVPYVICKWAMSLDGKMATRSGDSKWITSKEARRDSHMWRGRVECIMVGIDTVIYDDPVLSCRHPELTSHNPTRIILDSDLRIPVNSKIVETAGAIPTIVVIDAGKNKAVSEKKELLYKKGVEIFECSACDTCEGGIDIRELLDKLGEKGYDSIFVEGGSSVHGRLLELSLVDKVICYIGNKIIGGEAALSPVGGNGPDKVSEALELDEIDLKLMGENIRVIGYPLASS